ncbi:MAG TPA: DUF2203 domain-containing protein [Isosphaeraceae bacterium]|jgi:hypothetical protein
MASSSKPVGASRRYFTVEEANRALPLVKMIVADIVRQFGIVDALRQRLTPVRARAARRSAADPYSEEVAQSEAEMEREEQTLRALIDELDRLGVELKGPEGLCDFPSLRDGREVYLCWRLGEPAVGHWHELDAGVAGRQPLTATPGARTGPRAH